LTVRSGKLHVALALTAILAGGLLADPSLAQSTEEQLEEAKRRVAQLESEAQRATERYEEAHAVLVRTQDEIDDTRAELDKAADKILGLEEELAFRAQEAYKLGPTNTWQLLLEAESFTEFSDRLVYLERLAQDDADLATRVAVLAEELRRHRERMARLEEEQQRAFDEAERQKEIVYSRLEQAEAIKARFQEQFEAEQPSTVAAAAAAQAATGGGAPGSIGTVAGQALQACPAPGTSFADTFGAPRSGGRSHAGVDMMGSYGQPVYAAQSGTVSHSSSSLGGNQAYVHSSGGTYTFYAHLQGFSDASGSVAAGTLIGYIGDTGNATGTPHLHFEYHPNGVLVNPTPYVSAVC
jgi:peptidoglycan LD-endopeptidase LytH